MCALPLPGFSLDIPAKPEIRRVERFSGWCLDAKGDPADSLRLIVNGSPLLQLVPAFRSDISDLRREQGGAADAGFNGDLVLPGSSKRGDTLRIAVELRFRSAIERRECGSYIVTEDPISWQQRKRSYNLSDLLSSAALELLPNSAEWAPLSNGCGLIAGVPHFHAPSALPMVLIQRDGETHPYSDAARNLIGGLSPDRIFLDFGAGTKGDNEIYPNGVYLDAVHFQGLDIVNTLPRLPFKDDTFSLIVSQAVFEHVPDPFNSARELLRIVKPGGLVLIDTAFMQPLHGDPHHYFNMTEDGLREIMRGFEIVEMLKQPHQTSGFSLTMQISHILPTMKPGRWKDRLSSLHDDIMADMHGFEKDIGRIANRRIAAGVSVLARKPR
jgi:SAM-dependent methyltransferase